jgi:hypothetical protein
MKLTGGEIIVKQLVKEGVPYISYFKNISVSKCEQGVGKRHRRVRSCIF